MLNNSSSLFAKWGDIFSDQFFKQDFYPFSAKLYTYFDKKSPVHAAPECAGSAVPEQGGRRDAAAAGPSRAVPPADPTHPHRLGHSRQLGSTAARGGQGAERGGRVVPPAQGPPRGPHAQPRLPGEAGAGSPAAYPSVLVGAGRRRCPAASGLPPAPAPASSVPVSATSSPAPTSSAPVAVPAASFRRRVGRAPPAVSGPLPAGPAAAPLRLHDRFACRGPRGRARPAHCRKGPLAGPGKWRRRGLGSAPCGRLARGQPLAGPGPRLPRVPTSEGGKIASMCVNKNRKKKLCIYCLENRGHIDGLWSCFSWKRPRTSFSPIVNPAVPLPPLNHVHKPHIYTSFKCVNPGKVIISLPWAACSHA